MAEDRKPWSRNWSYLGKSTRLRWPFVAWFSALWAVLTRSTRSEFLLDCAAQYQRFAPIVKHRLLISVSLVNGRPIPSVTECSGPEPSGAAPDGLAGFTARSSYHKISHVANAGHGIEVHAEKTNEIGNINNNISTINHELTARKQQLEQEVAKDAVPLESTLAADPEVRGCPSLAPLWPVVWRRVVAVLIGIAEAVMFSLAVANSVGIDVASRRFTINAAFIQACLIAFTVVAVLTVMAHLFLAALRATFDWSRERRDRVLSGVAATTYCVATVAVAATMAFLRYKLAAGEADSTEWFEPLGFFALSCAFAITADWLWGRAGDLYQQRVKSRDDRREWEKAAFADSRSRERHVELIGLAAARLDEANRGKPSVLEEINKLEERASKAEADVRELHEAERFVLLTFANEFWAAILIDWRRFTALARLFKRHEQLDGTGEIIPLISLTLPTDDKEALREVLPRPQSKDITTRLKRVGQVTPFLLAFLFSQMGCDNSPIHPFHTAVICSAPATATQAGCDEAMLHGVIDTWMALAVDEPGSTFSVWSAAPVGPQRLLTICSPDRWSSNASSAKGEFKRSTVARVRGILGAAGTPSSDTCALPVDDVDDLRVGDNLDATYPWHVRGWQPDRGIQVHAAVVCDRSTSTGAVVCTPEHISAAFAGWLNISQLRPEACPHGVGPDHASHAQSRGTADIDEHHLPHAPRPVLCGTDGPSRGIVSGHASRRRHMAGVPGSTMANGEVGSFRAPPQVPHIHISRPTDLRLMRVGGHFRSEDQSLRLEVPILSLLSQESRLSLLPRTVIGRGPTRSSAGGRDFAGDVGTRDRCRRGQGARPREGGDRRWPSTGTYKHPGRTTQVGGSSAEPSLPCGRRKDLSRRV